MAAGMNLKKYNSNNPPLQDEEEGKFFEGITIATSEKGFLFHCNVGSIWLPKRYCPRAYANDEATVEIVFIPRWLIEKEPILKGE